MPAIKHPAEARLFSLKQRQAGFVALVILALFVFWSGVLDHQAEKMVDDALLGAGIIYATARVLNGTISVLQEIEISIVFATTSPFEILDPLNDIVERFSAAMTYALGSLALQKILLYITSNNIFNILLTISAAAAVATLVVWQRYSETSKKVFFSLLILRASIVFIILGNTLVDNLFLAEQVRANQRQLQSLQDNLSQASDAIKQADKNRLNEEENNQLQAEINAINARILALNAEVAARLAQIKGHAESIEQERNKYSLMEKLNVFGDDNPTIASARRKMASLQQDIDQRLSRIESLEEQRSALNEEIECRKTQAEGGSCSISDWFNKNVGLGGAVQRVTDNVKNTLEAAEDKIGTMIELMALMLLKTLVLPLLFWWLLYKLYKRLWAIE
ncbi:hypothetical protein G8764_13710 [Pseudomaricurvus alcaniphilus]|uniref:hypothetical protein n=1 Tax=Pseudomaricurvus alcaniphilus TaxID=1166482 RepID=UPI00140E0031|nr:hypothetical protein [Pseudomaricurvus alcaniphilus]NHN38359.1 hypothetical protein [Pseudomaricurvus alcaniphilus]